MGVRSRYSNHAAIAPDLRLTMPAHGPQTDYQDGLFDRIFIRLFSRKMANAVGQKTSLTGYE
ncbi:MAG: hypothetical protein AAFO87_13645, partial [Cyanobacteria bacterium J06607_6]